MSINSRHPRVTRRTFAAGLSAAGLVAGTAPFSIGRAQGAPLKVGVLLPRSGVQAIIGQDCQRGVDVAAGILKDIGQPSLQIMNADTESDVQIARAQAEKLINEGAQLLVGAFDSGQSTAIAQVAEQRGIPFVINIAAAPPITEQGYKFVFRNFPTSRPHRVHRSGNPDWGRRTRVRASRRGEVRRKGPQTGSAQRRLRAFPPPSRPQVLRSPQHGGNARERQSEPRWASFFRKCPWPPQRPKYRLVALN